MMGENHKSRGNWAPGVTLTDERFTEIFGERKPIDADGIVVTKYKDQCYREDYDWTKKNDKILDDYRRSKDKNDRKKINAEYFGRQQEHRDKIHRGMERRGESFNIGG